MINQSSQSLDFIVFLVVVLCALCVKKLVFRDALKSIFNNQLGKASTLHLNSIAPINPKFNLQNSVFNIQHSTFSIQHSKTHSIPSNTYRLL